MTKWRVAGMAMVCVAACLAGCELAGLAGKGSQDASFKFGKNQKVLVLVEAREGVALPPSFETTLADKIGLHLYTYKAADLIVGQEKLLALQDSDRAAYKKMTMAQIAQATGADVVLYVNVINLTSQTTSDNTVSQGWAEMQVKVVDRNGVRLWPGDAAGVRVGAHENAALLTDRDMTTSIKEIIDQLALFTGRMFHKYNLEDKELTKYDRI